ncbi:MAG: DUF4351 domain-containing protein, partial [Azovibrio sp.]|uniref:DUF4351 domain-containing protein n=1 Tax=Azovibrio sp. TaxID=1872673 RepID=UPI003C775580
MTLAERFDTWARQHEQKGEALVLQKLLTQRFGVLPADAVGKIAAASAEQIDTWVERVLDATSLEEVFRP